MKKIIFLLFLLLFSNQSFSVPGNNPDGFICSVLSQTGCSSPSLIKTNYCSGDETCIITKIPNTTCGGYPDDYLQANVHRDCVPVDDDPDDPGEDDGEDECPQGQTKDGRGQCNTKCEAPNVYNVMADTCQPVTNCTYPQLYNALANACADNPDNCAEGASRNVITGQCSATGQTSCPSGFACADASCLTCTPTGNSGSSSGGGSSASNTSSGSNNSSGSNSSVTPPPKPPVADTDNSDQSQSTGGSHFIPQGTSIAACRTQNSATVCKDYENCQLTFGVGKCVGMSDGQSCPNSYVLNGQKYCVLSGSGNSNSSSGSNTSTGTGGGTGSNSSEAGECDPTAKSYDECMGRNETPSPAQTAQIKNDFNTAANKSLDDYLAASQQDIEKASQDGVSFKNAPSGLVSALQSMFPSSQACSVYEISFPVVGKVVLNCSYFETWKRLFGWFLSVATSIYIFKLAMRPVER